MTYLLALIAVVTVAVLCWKAFGPEGSHRLGAGSARHDRVVGPDDDPEFLWQISRQHGDGESGTDH